MSAIERLRQIMVRLRDPAGGCPWDREQDWASIAPHTIEEAYELADAIARGEPEAVRDELGDVLFQVVFQARIAEERGLFDFDAVAASIAAKLERRHPHVFAGAKIDDAAAQSLAWEEHKRAERAASGLGTGALDGVTLGLPALTRAAKLGSRAAKSVSTGPTRRVSSRRRARNSASCRTKLTGVTGSARRKNWVTCCSPCRRRRVTSASMRRPRCATRMPSSSGGSA